MNSEYYQFVKILSRQADKIDPILNTLNKCWEGHTLLFIQMQSNRVSFAFGVKTQSSDWKYGCSEGILSKAWESVRNLAAHTDWSVKPKQLEPEVMEELDNIVSARLLGALFANMKFSKSATLKFTATDDPSMGLTLGSHEEVSGGSIEELVEVSSDILSLPSSYPDQVIQESKAQRQREIESLKEIATRLKKGDMASISPCGNVIITDVERNSKSLYKESFTLHFITLRGLRKTIPLYSVRQLIHSNIKFHQMSPFDRSLNLLVVGVLDYLRPKGFLTGGPYTFNFHHGRVNLSLRISNRR